MTHKVKHGFGSVEAVGSALTDGLIDSYDILLFNEGEMGWVNKSGETVVATTRTQEDIFVNGVDCLGIENGYIIPSGKSVDDVIKMMVRKSIPATYVRPQIVLKDNNGKSLNDVEHGKVIKPNISAEFVQNDAGELIDISIIKDGAIVANGTSSPLNYIGEEILVDDKPISFSATAIFDVAPVKTDNLGNESKENWFEDTTLILKNKNISGKRNMFYGTGSGKLPELTSDVIRGLSNRKLSPEQGYSFTMQVKAGEQYIVIAYPDTIRDLSNLTYVEGNDTNLVQSLSKTMVDVADARGENYGLIPYKVFTYSMAVKTPIDILFNITI